MLKGQFSTSPGLRPGAPKALATETRPGVNTPLLNTIALAMGNIWSREPISYGPGTLIGGMAEPDIRTLPVADLPVVEACASLVLEAGIATGTTVGGFMDAVGIDVGMLRRLVGDQKLRMPAATLAARLHELAKAAESTPAAAPAFHHFGVHAEANMASGAKMLD